MGRRGRALAASSPGRRVRAAAAPRRRRSPFRLWAKLGGKGMGADARLPPSHTHTPFFRPFLALCCALFRRRPSPPPFASVLELPLPFVRLPPLVPPSLAPPPLSRALTLSAALFRASFVSSPLSHASHAPPPPLFCFLALPPPSRFSSAFGPLSAHPRLQCALPATFPATLPPHRAVQLLAGGEKRAESGERRAESGGQRAESDARRAESDAWRVESDARIANRFPPRASSAHRPPPPVRVRNSRRLRVARSPGFPPPPPPQRPVSTRVRFRPGTNVRVAGIRKGVEHRPPSTRTGARARKGLPLASFVASGSACAKGIASCLIRCIRARVRKGIACFTRRRRVRKPHTIPDEIIPLRSLGASDLTSSDLAPKCAWFPVRCVRCGGVLVPPVLVPLFPVSPPPPLLLSSRSSWCWRGRFPLRGGWCWRVPWLRVRVPCAT